MKIFNLKIRLPNLNYKFKILIENWLKMKLKKSEIQKSINY